MIITAKIEKRYSNAERVKELENCGIDTKWKLIDSKEIGDDDLNRLYT